LTPLPLRFSNFYPPLGGQGGRNNRLQWGWGPKKREISGIVLRKNRLLNNLFYLSVSIIQNMSLVNFFKQKKVYF
jgi:hypothetical protein